MKVCVFSGSVENLNTSMKIKLDDGTVAEAWISDAYAEEATVKSVKEAYLKQKSARDAELEKFLEQAKRLGIQVAIPGDTKQLAVAQDPPKPPPPKQAAVDRELAGDGVVPAVQLDQRAGRAVTSVGGSAQTAAGNVAVASYQSIPIKATSKTDEDKEIVKRVEQARASGQARMVTVEGRGGQPMLIPGVRKDGTGTTRIRIAQTMNDTVLQRRFKDFGADSIRDETPGFVNGYQAHLQDCPICRGDGTAMNAGVMITCPKCKGSGFR